MLNHCERNVNIFFHMMQQRCLTCMVIYHRNESGEDILKVFKMSC